MASALSTSVHSPTRVDRRADLHLVSNLEIRSTVSPAARWAMRVVDVACAAVMLVLLSPVMVAVAVAVRRSSLGPIIYRQERIGKDGRLFNVFKFRSMTVGTDVAVLADEESRRRYEENDFKLDPADPRITAVGRFIRATSLDELPQLFNVLRGDMSLVGVRPLLARELALRSRHDQELYSLYRPGLTGLWQVEGRSLVGNEVRSDLDRRYLESWSPMTNVRLLARTPRVVLRRAGAH
jgi:lipopolysaccharide/colanic/teichoic acid biosynthesis glycosyltransferase